MLIANSSWYLVHYRFLLIKELSKKNKLITMSPVDMNSRKLSEYSIFIPWRIERSKDTNIFSLFVSFLRMLFLVRAIKPKLVHSHTLKANLLASIVTAIYGIPSVLSFAGMGRMSKRVGLSRIFFTKILELIGYFSSHQRESRLSWVSSYKRTALIFQNPIDKKTFDNSLDRSFRGLNILIPGSGLPQKYLNNDNALESNQWYSGQTGEYLDVSNISLIYCGRLLKSKGIDLFLDICSEATFRSCKIFGSIDPSSNDSLTKDSIRVFSEQNSNLNFQGSILDPLLLLKDSYPILILPSEYGEGLSRTILEAISLKIPVICSNTATCGIFNDDLLYVANDSTKEEYMKQISRVIIDYNQSRLRDKLFNSYNFIQNDLTESSIVDHTIKLYDQLLNDHVYSYLIGKDLPKENNWLAQ